VPTIVIPFRRQDAKQRLPEAVRRLVVDAMLADVVAAATEVGEVVIADGAGQGPAVEAALSGVRATPVLVVNSDLPAATPRDLLALLGSLPESGLAVVAAEDGTTNALALASPALFSPVYGPGSAARFLELGPSRSVEIPNLAADVDTLDDLLALEGRLGPRTAAALEALAAPAG
jgi:2-phospho-L-lactate guanylyltransferase (CobY/MobA/RfbA family)